MEQCELLEYTRSALREDTYTNREDRWLGSLPNTHTLTLYPQTHSHEHTQTSIFLGTGGTSTVYKKLIIHEVPRFACRLCSPASPSGTRYSRTRQSTSYLIPHTLALYTNIRFISKMTARKFIVNGPETKRQMIVPCRSFRTIVQVRGAANPAETRSFRCRS